MRITTRVATGLFLVAALLIGTLGYQLAQMEKLQSVNRELSLIKLESARVSVRLLQGIEGVREFAAKSAVLGDPDYRTQLDDWERAVDDDLGALAGIGLSAREETIRGEMEAKWDDYLRIAPALAGDPIGHIDEMDRILTDLRSHTEDLISANEAVVAERAASSAAAADRAFTVALIAAGFSLFLAGLLSVLLYLSISGPLLRLTRGTRELAQGHFDHRLEIRGPGELMSLGEDFNHMAERLGELEDMKQDFVSHVSHELKTPLAAIQETIEVLLDRLPGPITEKQERLLGLARKSSGRLSSMISNLLEISRLEAGAGGYDPGWSDLAELARSLVEEMEPLAAERNVRLLVHADPEPASAVCDRERIGDVVGNLVGNALKFTPPGSTVRVGLMRVARVPDEVPARGREVLGGESPPFLLLSVEDEGPGIPDDHKERIFEKFHQVNLRERIRGQGVGLGLAIAERVVSAHAGAIWVEDRPGGGAAFRVLLPRIPFRWGGRVPPQRSVDGKPARARREARVARASGGSSRATILFALLAGLGSAACASTPPVDEVPDPLLDAPVDLEEEEPDPPTSLPDQIVFSTPAEVRLARGWALLEEGHHGEAAEQFQAVVDEGETGRRRAEALWGLALVHLSPESPAGDPDRAREYLASIEEDFGSTLLGLQATWTLALLDELRQIQDVAARQEAVLRQLGETVELLKQIDLTRRPARTPRPDSLQHRRPR